MNSFIALILAVSAGTVALGQGTVTFNNSLPENLCGDKKIYLAGTDRGPGAGYSAGLLLLRELTPIVVVPFRSNASGSADYFIQAPF